MKFKLVEEFSSGNNSTARDTLNEEVLSEAPSTGLIASTSAYVRDAIKLYLSSGKYVKLDDKNKGQTSLLTYLCKNNNVSTEGVEVHHINFNHNDYDKDNICLLKKDDHHTLHTTLLSESINDLTSTMGIKYKSHLKKLRPEDFTEEHIAKMSAAYVSKMTAFIEDNRLDKHFP